MKSLIAATGLMAFAITPAAANDQFIGTTCITAVTSGCTTNGTTGVGDCMFSRFTAPNVGGTDQYTSLTMLHQNNAQNYHLGSGTLIGSTFVTVQGANIHRNAAFGTAQMRITSMVPNPIGTSKTVVLKGNINTYDGDSSCNVGFATTGYREP
jgi:hypothetical protein